MTNNNNSDRLDRIENALDRLVGGLQETSANIDRLNIGLQETKAIANSNSRAIQAMMEQQVTDRLKHEEAMNQMRDIMRRITETQSGLTRILINHDEDRPTILRRLMAIENKVDQILERDRD